MQNPRKSNIIFPMKFITDSAEKTKAVAYDFASRLHGGEVVLLCGELGAGKTTFTKGLVAGLGSSARVVSPTFTIMHSYEDGRLPVYHFDMYRMESEDELYELGLDDYLYDNGVCVIEWNKFSRLPKKVYEICITTLSEDTREVEICER